MGSCPPFRKLLGSSPPQNLGIYTESRSIFKWNRVFASSQIACPIGFGNKLKSILVVIPLKVADVSLNTSTAPQQGLSAR